MKTTFDKPIVFHHMHAGCVTPFINALWDALECPKPGWGFSVIIYGMAQNEEEMIFDLREGRLLQGTGSSCDERPYPQWVCTVEYDISTIELIFPLESGEPYWDKVEFIPCNEN